jgi:hypothetical protein
MRDPARQGMGEALRAGSLTAGHPGRSLGMTQSWQLHGEGTLASRAVRSVMPPFFQPQGGDVGTTKRSAFFENRSSYERDRDALRILFGGK